MVCDGCCAMVDDCWLVLVVCYLLRKVWSALAVDC